MITARDIIVFFVGAGVMGILLTIFTSIIYGLNNRHKEQKHD